ncbi:MAG TPA: ion channel [Blastocatellia bacterium]|nr:ion channel [Blastocatellia bacterium]
MNREIVITNIQADRDRDLGFGAVVASESSKRLLNRDGSFNVSRTGLSLWMSLSPYHSLLTMSWPKFISLVGFLYVFVNAFFAVAYLLCGAGALNGEGITGINSEFLRSFFFSVQTLATIGYGHIHPMGLAANVVVTIEALVGLLGFALITGILFARFSRPTAKVLFSDHAIIAPYHGITAFEFRLTNARRNQLVELGAKLILAVFEESRGRRMRRFYPLELERDKVAFFPLSWTIVHPINEDSPLWQKSPDDLAAMGAEFLILLTGIDETFSQTVHARSSYQHDEIIWNAKFGDIYNRPTQTGSLTIDVRRLDLIEKVREGTIEVSKQ